MFIRLKKFFFFFVVLWSLSSYARDDDSPFYFDPDESFGSKPSNRRENRYWEGREETEETAAPSPTINFAESAIENSSRGFTAKSEMCQFYRMRPPIVSKIPITPDHDAERGEPCYSGTDGGTCHINFLPRIDKIVVGGGVRLEFSADGEKSVTISDSSHTSARVKVIPKISRRGIAELHVYSNALRFNEEKESLPIVKLNAPEFADAITIISYVDRNIRKTKPTRVFINRLKTKKFTFQGARRAKLYVTDFFFANETDLRLLRVTGNKRELDVHSGNIELDHMWSENINIYVEGPGGVELSGRAKNLSLTSNNPKLFDSADVAANNLEVQNVFLNIGHTSSVKVNPLILLTGKMSGVSKVLCDVGDPQINVEVFCDDFNPKFTNITQKESPWPQVMCGPRN